MRYGLTILMVLACASVAQAQTVTSYTLKTYNVANMSAPVSTYTFPAAQVTCGLTRVATPPTVTNPTTVLWEDPADPARDCRWVDPGTGPLFALPFSPVTVYRSRLAAVNAAGTGPDSPDSLNSFTRPGAVPASPALLRLSGS